MLCYGSSFMIITCPSNKFDGWSSSAMVSPQSQLNHHYLSHKTWCFSVLKDILPVWKLLFNKILFFEIQFKNIFYTSFKQLMCHNFSGIFASNIIFCHNNKSALAVANHAKWSKVCTFRIVFERKYKEIYDLLCYGSSFIVTYSPHNLTCTIITIPNGINK